MNPNKRYRCNACGNLTRFDVIKMQRTSEFHHLTTDGKLTIEDKEILEQHIESVHCRWCESGSDIAEIENQLND
jgi:hypothetical protein